MPLIDLSQPITPNMPVYPGDPKPKITLSATIEKDGYAIHHMKLHTQLGTHVEVASHFLMQGEQLQQVSLDRLIGMATIIDIPCRKIEIKDLSPFQKIVRQHPFLILRSGHMDTVKRINPNGKKRPILNIPSIQWILRQHVKLIAIDSFDFDKPPDYPGHKLLFQKRIIVVEGLINLHTINKNSCKLFVIPLPLQKVEGSPARVFASI